ncbi:hypothetical protein [Campylobacter concisus]|nr:hypothetical protein [Campylobacter concisus]
MYFDFIDVTKFGIFLNSFFGAVVVFFAIVFSISSALSLFKN